MEITVGIILVFVLGLIVSLTVLYFLIKAAVCNGIIEAHDIIHDHRSDNDGEADDYVYDLHKKYTIHPDDEKPEK